MRAAQAHFDQNSAEDDEDQQFGEVFGEEEGQQVGEQMQGGEEGRQVFIQVITGQAEAAQITQEQVAQVVAFIMTQT